MNYLIGYKDADKNFGHEDPKEASKQVDQIIRNTYRTLMTRGQKGCYVYCTDKTFAEYLKARILRVYEEERELRQMLVAEERGLSIRTDNIKITHPRVYASDGLINLL